MCFNVPSKALIFGLELDPARGVVKRKITRAINRGHLVPHVIWDVAANELWDAITDVSKGDTKCN